MIEKPSSEEFNCKINEDGAHAQILIQISNSQPFQKAKKIIEDLGAPIIQIKHLEPNWILVKLNVMDVRGIVLKLTENGFLNIKGINAIQSL